MLLLIGWLYEHHDFATLSTLHGVHGQIKFFEGKSMGDDRAEIDTSALEEIAHAVPRLPQTPPDDAMDGDAFEDDIVRPVEIDGVIGDAKERGCSARTEQLESLADGDGCARKFEQAIGTSAVGYFCYCCGEIITARVEYHICTHALCQIEAVGADIGGDDGCGTRRAKYTDRHQPNRATASYQHAFSACVECERGVNGVAKIFQEGGDFPGHVGRVAPYVGGGQAHIFSEDAIDIDTEDFGVATDVGISHLTLVAASADNVAFCRDKIAYGDVGDVCANIDDFATHLVTDDEGWDDSMLRPRIPPPNMQIGPADRCSSHFDKHIFRADRRNGPLGPRESWTACQLHNSAHGS